MRLHRFFMFAATLVFSAGAQADAIDDLRMFYEEVDTLSTHFEQVQTDGSGVVLQKASGVFLLERPGKFRWEYQTPYDQIIVSDGEVFKFYDVGLSQVTIRDVDTTLRATPALLLTGGAALEEAFNVKVGGMRNGMPWLRLTPRAETSDFAEIRLGLRDQIPAVMELDDRLGQTTRIEFADTEVNPSLAASRFTIDIPDDVEVVDGRAMNNGGARQ